MKGLFEANGESPLFQEDGRENKELDRTGPEAGSQIKQRLGLFRTTFWGEKVKCWGCDTQTRTDLRVVRDELQPRAEPFKIIDKN